MNQIAVIREADFAMVIRVVIAFALGAVVGYERERVHQPAGLRTHMLVAAGAACFSVASIYGFNTLQNEADLARVAANIVSGVGFLGAAAIFRSGPTIRGLTTAAGIWMTAAIGMLVGLGLLVMAVAATVLTFVTLFLLRSAPFRTRAGRTPAAVGEPSISAKAEDASDG
jgi:putative Mg2+ transporter-C (MgtC) family protein